jgi:hypothetical protein
MGAHWKHTSSNLVPFTIWGFGGDLRHPSSSSFVFGYSEPIFFPIVRYLEISYNHTDYKEESNIHCLVQCSTLFSRIEHLGQCICHKVKSPWFINYWKIVLQEEN